MFPRSAVHANTFSKKKKKNSSILGFLGMNLNLQYKIIYFIK